MITASAYHEFCHGSSSSVPPCSACMGSEIAVALWHSDVEITNYVSQLLDHNQTSTAPSHDHHSLNPHVSVTILMHEVDGEIKFTTHGCPGHEVSVYALRSSLYSTEAWGKLNVKIIIDVCCYLRLDFFKKPKPTLLWQKFNFMKY